MKISIKDEISEMLFPNGIKCIVCGKEIQNSRYGLCADCKFDINGNFCLRCGRHKIGIGDYCGECSEQSLNFDEARSAVCYDGNAKMIIRRLKYGNARYLVESLCEHMLDVLLATDWNADAITFVPVHKSRLKKRGYNQAELLANALSARVNLPCLRLIEKIKHTPNQARLDRTERLENVKGSFAVISDVPKHIILVDDVMTTGATINECCNVLKRAGASVVYVLTFASVPERPVLDKPGRKISRFLK